MASIVITSTCYGLAPWRGELQWFINSKGPDGKVRTTPTSTVTKLETGLPIVGTGKIPAPAKITGLDLSGPDLMLAVAQPDGKRSTGLVNVSKAGDSAVASKKGVTIFTGGFVTRRAGVVYVVLDFIRPASVPVTIGCLPHVYVLAVRQKKPPRWPDAGNFHLIPWPTMTEWLHNPLGYEPKPADYLDKGGPFYWQQQAASALQGQPIILEQFRTQWNGNYPTSNIHEANRDVVPRRIVGGVADTQYSFVFTIGASGALDAHKAAPFASNFYMVADNAHDQWMWSLEKNAEENMASGRCLKSNGLNGCYDTSFKYRVHGGYLFTALVPGSVTSADMDKICADASNYGDKDLSIVRMGKMDYDQIWAQYTEHSIKNHSCSQLATWARLAPDVDPCTCWHAKWPSLPSCPLKGLPY